MKISKKIISVIVAVALLISTFAAVATITSSAESTKESVWNGTLSAIQGGGGVVSNTINADGSVTIVTGSTLSQQYQYQISPSSLDRQKIEAADNILMIDFTVNAAKKTGDVNDSGYVFSSNFTQSFGSTSEWVSPGQTKTFSVDMSTQDWSKYYLAIVYQNYHGSGLKDVSVTIKFYVEELDSNTPEFIFNTTYVTLSDNTLGVAFGNNDGYPNINGAGLTAGNSVTVTTKKTVDPGVYDLELFARSYSGRAPIDVEINGTKVASSLSTATDFATNRSFPIDSITIPETTVITIKFTTTGGGSLYLNSLKLTKTAECGIVMDSGAAMRLDSKTDGIRFSATVPTATLNALRNSGATVIDFGMIIAPVESNLTTETMVVDNAEEMKTESMELPQDKNSVLASYGRADAESDQSGTVTQIIGALVEIKTGNANKQYVARAYVKYEDTTGIHYLYSNIGEARSIAHVAHNLKNAADGIYTSLCDNHKAVVDKWAQQYIA